MERVRSDGGVLVRRGHGKGKDGSSTRLALGGETLYRSWSRSGSAGGDDLGGGETKRGSKDWDFGTSTSGDGRFRFRELDVCGGSAAGREGENWSPEYDFETIKGVDSSSGQKSSRL